jgi:hypothetical protein
MQSSKLTPDLPPRETCPLDVPASCEGCGAATMRYVIADWTISCSPACDVVLDRRLGEDLDRLNALPLSEDDDDLGW